MIRHSVFFLFSEQADDGSRAQHISDFAALPDAIGEIRAYESGRTVADPASGAEPEFHVAHYLDFDDAPALKRYIEHDAHQRFIARNKASWERVLVVDTELSQLQT